VLLISLDGFRADYFNSLVAQRAAGSGLPALRWFALQGARAAALIPPFPTKTFPAHYSLATGLLPAWSGVIGNSFLLKLANGSSAQFTMQSTDPVFWLGEPIWLTARKAGLSVWAGTWPGSSAPLPGWDVSALAAAYNDSQTASQRVDVLLSKLTSPAGPPAFSTLYMNDVDNAGHAFGPDSDEVMSAIATVDAALWKLLQGMNASGLLATTHIALVADHGMAGLCGCGRVVPAASILPNASAYANITALLASGAELNGPYVGLPCPNCSSAQARALASAMNASAVANGFGSHFAAFFKDDLPARFGGYGQSGRVWPVVGSFSLGWVASTSTPYQSGCGGSHGWDNAYGAMGALGVFVGPRFGPGGVGLLTPAQVAGGPGADTALSSVEVYNVMVDILGIQPAANNGTAGYAQRLLLPRC
jgi:ectonucleotide pyrophosphatase/phosphodiesterase family protein 1/3